MKKSRIFKRFLSIFLGLMLVQAPLFAAGNKKVLKLINEACQSLSAEEYDDCISSCDRALAIDPVCPAAYYTRGFAYRYKGDYSQSISDFDRAIEIDPKYAAAYYARAKSYFYEQEYDKAWNDLRKAKGLKCSIEPEFLQELRKASGRKE